jgi:hypothetical protein
VVPVRLVEPMVEDWCDVDDPAYLRHAVDDPCWQRIGGPSGVAAVVQAVELDAFLAWMRALGEWRREHPDVEVVPVGACTRWRDLDMFVARVRGALGDVPAVEVDS